MTLERTKEANMTMKSIKRALVVAAVATPLAVSAATTETMTATATYVAPITVTGTSDLRFGYIDTAITTNNTAVISTADARTAAQGLGDSAAYGAAAATVTATAGESISIDINNLNYSGNAEYTLGTFKCTYNGGAETDCDDGDSMTVAGGDVIASATVKVGATLTQTAASAAAGTHTATFDLVVAYN